MSAHEALRRAERKFEAVQGILAGVQSQVNDAIRELSLAMTAMNDALDAPAGVRSTDTAEGES